jgi:hypothetical protein
MTRRGGCFVSAYAGGKPATRRRQRSGAELARCSVWLTRRSEPRPEKFGLLEDTPLHDITRRGSSAGELLELSADATSGDPTALAVGCEPGGVG